ncbi:MAG: MBL fold metallo-hydrolase [Bdellovibrionales bacterium]|nr:MBL fold metallo-hydrolase [Bdellovibrionales bacterium]
MEIKAFFDQDTSTLSYLVWDPSTFDALVIDPVLNFDPASGATTRSSVVEIEQAIQSAGLKPRMVLETHAHADHLSGSQALKALFPGLKLAIGERIVEVQRTFSDVFGIEPEERPGAEAFDRLLKDGEVFPAGSLEVRVVATPGHTPACVSYLIGDALFVGDALFMPDSGTGRCDFPGGDARRLYDSVHRRMYGLPPATRIFVGHDYQPGGRELRYQTTVSEERASNIQLKAETTEDEYVRFRTERDRRLTAPRLLYPSLYVNIRGGRLPEPDVRGRRFLKWPIHG